MNGSTTDLVSVQATKGDGEAVSEGDARCQQGQGKAQLVLGEKVCHQREGRWTKRRFPDANKHPGHEEACESMSKATGGCSHAPHRDAKDDERLAVMSVRPPAERQSEEGVEKREGKA